MSDATPSLVADRYRLDERIDSGPMGEVWRGYDTRADWVVAVKVLGARVAGAATREVLRQHAQAVAKVIHPNVAMVLDVGDRDGAPFLVMEFLTGLSLGEELAAGGPLRIVDVCDLIGQAAAGLDAAHRAGVVHGQVNPDSFRRAGSGVLKVVGFGMDDREPGPSGYLAPERAAGQPAQPSGDLYALGCVCYELLTGRPPFGDTPGEQPPNPAGEPVPPGAIRTEKPTEPLPPGAIRAEKPIEPLPPSAIRAEVPAELDRLVLAMLAAAPAQRPGSGESIRRALAAIARPRPNPAAAPVTGVSLREAAPPVTGTHQREPGHPGAPREAGHLGGPREAGHLGGPREPGHPGGTGAYGLAGTRAGDTAIYQAGDLPPEPSPNRKLFLQLGAAVAIIVAVSVGMVVWAGARQEPVATPTPTFAPATLPETLTPSPTPTEPSSRPTPTEQPPGPVSTLGPGDVLRGTEPASDSLGSAVPPGGWGRWVEAFDESLMSQQALNGISPRAAAKARDKLRKAGRRFEEGRVGPALDEIRAMYKDLGKAQREGELASSGPLPDFVRKWRLPQN
ncbi:serine/threonine-protein kinase [Nonomuraea jiangxiensis]|uniref:non-specific serine/threonine protein kinase n=1 Tax=Nonomuraea jiangxiensis TaxID=633440 RepID=A0A1G8HEZ9_9ACTN|nr:serine/threonine-protein kinase [Nonomuraea jiangxiensis]SDI05257.1 serine/threonine protein kinase [Nonomuraea jiangxiensis]